MANSRTSLLHALVLGVLSLGVLASCSTGGGGRETGASTPRANDEDNTYDQESVLSAAEGVFGKGAEGLAGLIEKAFADNGRPNAYIAGKEAGGGLLFALRYGNGTLHHKIEGQRPVHWTGPSVGFEAGGDAAKVFTLVYNLYDTEDIYKRFPAVEGQFYFIGGLGMNYLQSGDVRVAQIRLGVGLRATANVGYIKFTKEGTLNPL
ncbi:MAG: DUF1134 domain-containing protein [Alphaproteobacteria bacterium]|nr:MAG: DUF1134 domain-containing protein [Alphaproteobacteria bacterium]